ncbi:hypothetical protein BC829DRAFT_398533 [Chytridium lagenaria]|nr:hypothetical protein BC829DRAFT_398533 [Chytridium lagenaria]
MSDGRTILPSLGGATATDSERSLAQQAQPTALEDFDPNLSTATINLSVEDIAAGSQSANGSNGSGQVEKDRRIRQKRIWLYRNDKEVSNICTNNGIAESAFANRPHTITRIEMCHFNYPVMTALHNFAQLTSLCIVAQDVSTIAGLEDCPLLEQLWVCETRLSTISNIEKCINLKELYLYSNRIRKIQGLENLVKLENYGFPIMVNIEISKIQNLATLVNLKDIQVGNNRIASIGDSLNENLALEELNIAGNRLSSFRDVLYLARLPRLTSLCLSDPNFADNPICSLCNYQTHVIYHLPNLRSLDTLDVTDESRRIISATILKKRMYYNMRIRTIKRNTNFLIKSLQTYNVDDEKHIEDDVVVLTKRIKRIQRKRDDLGFPPPGDKIEQFSGISEKFEDSRKRLVSLIETKTKCLQRLQEHKRDVINQISQQSDMAIRKLLIELETGGNVRDDSWFENCEALVKSMILRATSTHHYRRIQIHRISRVHNRFLKNRFEGKLRLKSDHTHSFEYLCFQTTEARSDDVFQAVEHGFADLMEVRSSGGTVSNTGILLSNYLDLQEPLQGDGDGQRERERKRLRQAVIVKSFANKVQRTDADLATLNSTDLNGVNCIYRDTSKPGLHSDPCRQYLVFDRELILPEYFVEFSLESDLDRLTTKIERLMVDIAYSSKLSQADMPSIVLDVIGKISETLESRKMDLDLPISALEIQYPEIKVSDSIGEPPPVSLTLEILGRKPPFQITCLNLSMIPITSSLDSFQVFSNIRSLSLSGCGLKEVPPIRHFPKLETLDLSFNYIVVLSSGFGASSPACHSLRHLDLAGNHICSLDSLRCIQEHLKVLDTLDLRYNPICHRKGYRGYLLANAKKCLKSVKVLDDTVVEPSERNWSWRKMVHIDAAALDESSLAAVYIKEHSSSQSHLFRPLSVRTQAGYGSSAAQHEYWQTANDIDISEIPSSPLQLNLEILTTLEMDSCNLFDLDFLPSGLVNLRWASFRNNNLRDLSRLVLFQRLEELSLENNDIEHIDPLTSLGTLTKLDVSNNRITSIEAAGMFQNLMLLSLENNLVKNLKPLAKLSTLMEFYAGNNYIADLYSIFPLKELPRLIILDLTGNSVCQVKNYRLFGIFHLSRLKILDGTSISPKEQNAAKEVYLGKLTLELLGEKIGHFSFKNITELDLRNCKIREIDCFANGEFRSIRKLNFDHNLLSNIDPFLSLTGLRSLSINNNKIERLLSSDGPAVMSPSGWRIETPDAARTKPLLPLLEELHLGIADLGLYRFPQLKMLFTWKSNAKVDGLEHMTGLTELVLDKNQIKAVDPSSFLSLINVKELHIKENRLRSLSHFDCLPNLQYLFLNGNRINETNEIEKMKLPSLLEIHLSANGVTRKQMYRFSIIMRFPHILSIDGKDVLDEERQRAESYFMEQCINREESSSVMKIPLPVQQTPLSSSMSSMVKLPIKITSVVLDGLEMKLAANSSGFGSHKA